MRSADRRLFSSRGVAAGLALAALLAVAAVATGEGLAQHAKRQRVGGLTGVLDETIKVGSHQISSPSGTPNAKKEFYALYAGDQIKTTVSGRAWFNLEIGKKTLYCTVRPHGPDAGVLVVSPSNGVVMAIQSGKLQCATNAKGGQKTIKLRNVTLKTVDPVFSTVVSSTQVVVDLRGGTAVIKGQAAKKAVVVAKNAKKNQPKAKEVVVPANGNPLPPKTVALTASDKASLSQLSNKAPPPPPDTTPPVVTLRGRPANPSARPVVRFRFTSEPGVIFSCSRNGEPFHVCASGDPQTFDPGLSTFAVEATDAAGNTSAPETFTWFNERPPNAPIVFQSDRSGVNRLYTINPDGSGLTPLTDGKSGSFDPAWSPNGKQVAFESTLGQKNSTEIWVITVSNGHLDRITMDPAIDRTPKWSPDGKSIVFASNQDGKYQIYSVSAAGGEAEPLTSGSENADPSWSPDGKKIAFESDRDGNNEIYVMDADGRHETRVTKNTSGDFNPAWSPDGKKILFESDRDGNHEIYVMDADGSNQERLTNDPGRDSNPAWSPDGSRIVFSSNRGGNVDLWIMDADGMNVRRLTSGAKNDLAPSW